MAENMIKDFVKKQTTTLNIGTPRQRPAANVTPTVTRPTEIQAESPVKVEVPETAPSQTMNDEVKPTKTVKGKVGRPKGDVEKVKLSVYVPAEVKAKLIKLQHMTYKQSINDVMIEGIYMLLTKYEL